MQDHSVMIMDVDLVLFQNPLDTRVGPRGAAVPVRCILSYNNVNSDHTLFVLARS